MLLCRWERLGRVLVLRLQGACREIRVVGGNNGLTTARVLGVDAAFERGPYKVRAVHAEVFGAVHFSLKNKTTPVVPTTKISTSAGVANGKCGGVAE
jgi:hypothetical protein